MAIYGESEYIHGIHDPGGEFLIDDPPGWIVFTHELGHDPMHTSGFDYRPWADSGFGVIARLNNGYSPNGTIPPEGEYYHFAQRAESWVKNSRGCHLWIIGNEPNHEMERPDGEYIEPEDYAVCYALCRDRIKGIKETRGENKVLVAPVAPWYPPDWIAYQRDMMSGIETMGGADGIVLHTYTHGPEPALISSNQKMESFRDRHYQFRAYRDMIDAIPSSMRNLPIFITETDQVDPWLNVNSGWCQRAIEEIDRYNEHADDCHIHCLAFYRYPRYDKWYISGKENLYRDIEGAVKLKVKRPAGNNGGEMKEVWREDFDGEWRPQDGIGNVQTPVRTDDTVLRAFWYMGDVDDFGDKDYVQPEIEKERADIYPYRVKSGEGSWNQFNSYNIHFGGGYIIPPALVVGGHYRFSIWGHVWTAGSVHGDPPDSDGDPYNCQSFVALGPRGQRDLFEEGVIIGTHHWNDAWDEYIEYSMEFVAQVERPTLFYVCRFKHPVQNNNMFWDQARLYNLDDEPGPGPGPGNGVTEERAREIAREEIEIALRGSILPWE